MSEWQPIETAPKEPYGERILVASADGVYIVLWSIDQPFGERYTWATESEGPGYSSEIEATHWMPLPKLPAELKRLHELVEKK